MVTMSMHVSDHLVYSQLTPEVEPMLGLNL